MAHDNAAALADFFTAGAFSACQLEGSKGRANIRPDFDASFLIPQAAQDIVMVIAVGGNGDDRHPGAHGQVSRAGQRPAKWWAVGMAFGVDNQNAVLRQNSFGGAQGFKIGRTLFDFQGLSGAREDLHHSRRVRHFHVANKL